MAKRTPTEVYQALRAAGFQPDAAATMVAISGAESGYRDNALGDQNLQNSKWGPSYGLFQVRTLKQQTGQGTARDISWLSGSILNQAKAAYEISRGGQDFSPWTVYNTGAYQEYVGTAKSAADRVGDALIGGFWDMLPDLNLKPGSIAGAVIGGARSIAVEAAFVVLGLVLVGAGLWRATGPARKRMGAAA